MIFETEFILFIVGAIAGFVNVFAGGGSTITLPALIFAGLDAATANGTNRIAVLLQNVSGVGSFHQQKVRGIDTALKYSLFTIPGAIAGAFFSIQINQVWFERILGIIMIGVLISLFQKRNPDITPQDEKKPGIFYYLSLIGIGFYGGFIQVGVGFLLMAALFHFLKTSLIRVNFFKLIIVFVYTIPVLLFFVLNGNVEWLLGFIMAAGSMAGAWLAAHISVKKGDKIIKYVLAVTIVIMAVKLFL